jgi:CRISP-associated protein Cas1
MRKLLNTLYVTTPESYLSRDGENIVIKVDNKEKFRIPVHNVEGIVSFGYMGASPSLIALCAERNVAMSFVSEGGRFLGRFTGEVSGNVLLRRKQYRMADDEKFSLEIARLFIAGKVMNCRTVLQRILRDHPANIKTETMEKAIDGLLNKQKKVLQAKSLGELRGHEGESAFTYFSVFDHLILHQKEDFRMEGRTRRPPMDNVNALLSFSYMLLMHEVRAALESVGLDPCVGFLHVDRPGRQSLALDLMEEFRPFLSDRVVLSLINRKQVNGKGFVKQSAGGILMDDETRKEVITAWQKRKQEEIIHPFLNEKVSIGLLPYCQALLLARYLRGDLDNYPVFINK